LTVLDELRTFEQRLAVRLQELRPLIEEYEELQRIAERLGLDPEAIARPKSEGKPSRAAGSRTRTARRATTRGKGEARRRPGGTRATGAERRERVVTLIRENPGITVPDMSRQMGVDPPPLYRVVRKLQADGVVIKEGKGLRIP
jgi:hypothetical protein